MKARGVAIGAVLAVLGLAAAVGIGLAANAISDDSVGLSAQPLSAGDTLAPKATPQKAKARRRPPRADRSTQTDGSPAAPPTTSPATPQDDHGGGGGGSDDLSGSSGSGSSGSDSSGSNSGSDSSGSNSGSDSSGSSGSGSGDESGHGGDDD